MQSLNRRACGAWLTGLSGALVLASTGAAQTSPLYLSEWDTPTVYVVQGGAIIDQFSRANTQDGPGLAITDTIKFVGQDPGGVGHEYALDGTPLGGNFVNPSFDSLYDGATDGTRNWSIAHNDFDTEFAVVQGDADWGNLTVLFVPERRSSGIAYDAENNTLWVTNNLGGIDRVQQYDLSGNLISEFNAVHSGGGYGLALDPADGTLWITGAFGTSRQLFQYDRNGNLLDSFTLTGLGANIMGAEFAMPVGGFVLRTDDECPGRMTFTASGANPGDRIYFIYGLSEGNGPGVPGCPGLNVGIVNPRIAGSRVADANGEASAAGNVPANFCDRLRLQAVNIDACEVSNVLSLQ